MLLEAVLAALSVILAILALEFEDLLKSIVSFGAMCFSIAIIYWILNAPYVAVFQALIYGGAILALFLAAVIAVGRGGEDE
ncbi:MAG: hydrogenase subunit MbhD domain-containing protein [Candidatus Bathyarchaeia archaeon]